MNPSRTNPATAPWLPVELKEAKHQVRLAESVVLHDAELRNLIELATTLVQDEAAIIFAAGQFQYLLDRFPAGPIELPVRNVTAVDAVQYVDGAGQTIILDDVELSTSEQLPRLFRTGGVAWPAAGAGLDMVRIDFQAGWDSPAEVPRHFWRQTLAAIGAIWENDGEVEDLGKPYQALQARNHITYP